MEGRIANINRVDLLNLQTMLAQQQQADIENQQKLALAGGIGAGLIAGGAAAYGVNQLADPLIDKGLDAYTKMSVPLEDQTFYQGDRVQGVTKRGGIVEFTVDGTTQAHGSRPPISELKELNKSWDSFVQNPANRKVYYATPESRDGMGEARTKAYTKRGFVPAGENSIFPKESLVFDNRPMAKHAAPVYEFVDKQLNSRHANPEVFTRNKRIAKVGGAVGLGGLAALGTGIIANLLVRPEEQPTVY
jgi:hypothetical protein